jgi:hypothetical protein
MLVILHPPIRMDPARIARLWNRPCPRCSCPLRPLTLCTARTCSRDGPCPRSRRVPPHRLAPPVAAALHPPATACVKVLVADELHTNDLRTLRSVELHADIEFRIDEPPFSSKQQDVVLESACCKLLCKVFQIFQRYVASISYGCCKNRLRCCICCNGCTRILQYFIFNVSSVFRCMLQVCFI